MITTLIITQAICVGTSAYLTFKANKKQSSVKLKLISKEKDFKHYKAGGF